MQRTDGIDKPPANTYCTKPRHKTSRPHWKERGPPPAHSQTHQTHLDTNDACESPPFRARYGIPCLSAARHPPVQRPADQDDSGGLQLWSGVLYPCREQRKPGHDHRPRQALAGRARSCGEADEVREEPAAGGAERRAAISPTVRATVAWSPTAVSVEGAG